MKNRINLPYIVSPGAYKVLYQGKFVLLLPIRNKITINTFVKSAINALEIDGGYKNVMEKDLWIEGIDELAPI